MQCYVFYLGSFISDIEALGAWPASVDATISLVSGISTLELCDYTKLPTVIVIAAPTVIVIASPTVIVRPPPTIIVRPPPPTIVSQDYGKSARNKTKVQMMAIYDELIKRMRTVVEVV